MSVLTSQSTILPAARASAPKNESHETAPLGGHHNRAHSTDGPGVALARSLIALVALAGIIVHLILRFGVGASSTVSQIPLLVSLVCGSVPLLYALAINVIRRQFGSDLLAGISIVTSIFLGEYLAGVFVVLMLSGGQAIEAYAVRSASSVLRALASRMPSMAHRKRDSGIADVPVNEINIGDMLLLFPHEICPIDGIVMEGHGVMDESYLTGEPFQMSKAPGSEVLSGAINGQTALTIRATHLAVDSRYSRIVKVMYASEMDSPHMRRLGDQLGTIYTPVALGIALVAWLISGDPIRFLAVLVVATPCPLLIAIPIAIIGAISLCAKRGIIVKKPAVLEQVDSCRTLIFDKTGTLTYGEPRLSEVLAAASFERNRLLELTASLEQYSKHPLARAVLKASTDAGLSIVQASEISEPPGAGLRGIVMGRNVEITSRRKIAIEKPELVAQMPPTSAGLECVVMVDGAYGGTLRFRDEPRSDSKPFISHLDSKHHVNRLILLSGDREPEVRFLADQVGIHHIHAGKTPEEKLEIVRNETKEAKTLYLGDGINDAPALLAANVGIALGQNSDITTEAAGAVIMDRSLRKVDEFFHISRRMRRIAVQSAVGGMILSTAGMVAASLGYLHPVTGAILQEVIDLLAVVNALRAAMPPSSLSDI